MMPIYRNQLLIALTIVSLLQLSNQQQMPTCINSYTTANVPVECIGGNCTFTEGLSDLAVNVTEGPGFMLCLYLPGYNITISIDNSTDQFLEQIHSLYVYANLVEMRSNYSLVCESYLVIIVQKLVRFIDVSLTGAKVYVMSGQDIVIVNSNFVNESVIPSECSCVTQKTDCSFDFAFPFIFEQGNDNFILAQQFQQSNFNYSSIPNNAIAFIAMEDFIMNGSQIKYSIIGVFATEMEISSSTVTASGLGFPSDSGPGCGYFDEVLNQLLGCMGSGGSHGGFGGNSSPQNCYLLVSRLPYDNVRFPNQPGSGGGFFLPHSRESSSGGGVINVQASTITLINTALLAEGKNGIQGGGGGAGGTISMDCNKINGANLLISANGGNGDKISSSGSGGRVRVWNHQWRTENQTNSNVSITVYGGLGCRSNQPDNDEIQLSCGENGSIFSSPCRPGTSLTIPSYICYPCQLGTYQLTYGYAPCVACTAKPNNARWKEAQSGESVKYANSCHFDCDEGNSCIDIGFQFYEGECLTIMDKILKKIYATNIFISIGMVGIAILIYFVIRIIQRLGEQERLLTFDDPALNESYRKKFFRLEELPYHQMRVYVSGENHPFNPWRITEEAEFNLNSELKAPLTRISHILSRIIREVNRRSEYSKWQKVIVTGLRYTYYPLSRIVLTSMRKKKAREIFEEVDKFNKKIGELECLGVKFHVKPQHTVASLEIFNYTKSVLDFYIQNYFPLYILLEKAPFDGYVVDFTDPFFKVFINEIVQKETGGKSIENFLKETNKLLKNPARVLSCLNHLWTLSDINAKFQAFLWQPTTNILGIDKNYKIDNKQPLFLVLSSENMNNNHFVMNQNLPAAYLPEIESLRHKFIIRKELASQDHGNSLCLIQSSLSSKTLCWILGILSTVFLLLTIATFFLTIMIISKYSRCENSGWNAFASGFVIYFAIWPMCDFAASFSNFKTILSKNESFLADAISFNIFSVIKSLMLFIAVLAKYPSLDNNCISGNQFVWLSMIIVGVSIFVVQAMLRVKIIEQTK